MVFVATPKPIISIEEIQEMELPTIDLNSSDRSKMKELIIKACENYGFFKVINHGISHNIISNLEEESLSFFSKPMAEKLQAGPACPFGYGCKNIGFNGDVGEVEYLLLKTTSFSIYQLSQSISNDPTRFSSAVIGYIEAVKALACEILDLIAEGLGVTDTSVLSRLISNIDSDSVFRLNHYPPVTKSIKDNDASASYSASKVGLGEHSDPQILTILRSNDVCGLQISLEDGVWVPVPSEPTAFWVNVGDLLQVMTNGRLVSVRHRAVVNTSSTRMSMGYFAAPPTNMCIKALPQVITADKPSLYRPFTWAEYKKTTYSLRLGDSRLNLFRRIQDD